MENEELINKIAEEFEGFKELQDFNLMQLEQCFEVIKYRNITKSSVIEHLLDQLLSMIQTNKTRDLYSRICIYYHAINMEAAMEYAQYYLDFYNDDTVIKKIINKDNRIKKLKKEVRVNEEVL